MRGNSGKCNLILSTDEPAKIQLEESLIKGKMILNLHLINILKLFAKKQVTN